MNVRMTDREADAVAVAPRVSLADIEAAIASRYDTTADHAMRYDISLSENAPTLLKQLSILSLCFLVMRNGFVVVGKSAPASPENFNRDLGRRFAYEDAVRQLWPLMGYALKERLANK